LIREFRRCRAGLRADRVDGAARIVARLLVVRGREIRAATDALAADLEEQEVIVENRLPDLALAEHGRFVDELWPMLVSAAAPAKILTPRLLR
jgi:hypothetical protein